MKTIKFGVFALATAFFTVSCGNGMQNDETSDTTVTMEMQGTDTMMGSNVGYDNTTDGNNGNNTDGSMQGSNNGNMNDSPSTSDNTHLNDPSQQQDELKGKKTDLSRSPSTGHPGDNPPRQGTGSPNQ